MDQIAALEAANEGVVENEAAHTDESLSVTGEIMNQPTSSKRLLLLDFSRPQLADLLAGWDHPRYRADQVWSWLHQKQAAGASEMTNLPAALRERLAAETCINPLEQVYEQRASGNQTIKWLFRLPDGLTIETVLMLYPADEGRDERRTVCISTQAGCAMGCVFCATGSGRSGAQFGGRRDCGAGICRRTLADRTSPVFVRYASPDEYRRHGHG